MSVIVRTSFDKAKQYNGKGVEVKLGSKKHNVFFKVIIDDFSIEEALESGVDPNIVVYDYQGMTSNPIYLGVDSTDLYITKSYEFGNDITESDILGILKEVPKGVVPIIKLPSDYKDFEFVCRMCDKYDRLRFCGGIMFCAEGCRIGCCGRDILESAGISYPDGSYIKEGCACELDIISDEGLELVVTEKKTIKKKSTSKKASGGTKKQKNKMFGDLLSGFNVEL